MTGKCPSPNSSRASTPDANDSLRKSKDIMQRNSASKSSTQPSSFLAHNENDYKRPSLILNTKLSESVMAPTIFAASKFTAAPLRKKILQERNEVVNSVSKSLDFSTTNEFCNICFEYVRKSDVGFVQQDVSNSLVAKRENLETNNHKKTSPLPQVEALDADPTLPPYDPMTNYLSPRPKFLYYRPNPRINHYFIDINDGRRFDDGFSAESSEVDDEKDQEFELESSEESFNSEVQKIGTDLRLKSEYENATESYFECGSKSEIHDLSEFKSDPKSTKFRSFRRSGLISFLLIILLAFVNVPLSDTPTISSVPSTSSPNYRIFDEKLNVVSRCEQMSVDYLANFTTKNIPKVEVGSYSFVNMAPLVVDEPSRISVSYEEETEMKLEFKAIDLMLSQESDSNIEEEFGAEISGTESEMEKLVNEDAAENELSDVIYDERVNKEVSNVKNYLDIEVIVSENIKKQVEKKILDSIFVNVTESETIHPKSELKHEMKNSEIVFENAKEQVEGEISDSETIVSRNELKHEVMGKGTAVEDATIAMKFALVCGLLLPMLAFGAALVSKVKGEQIQNGKQTADSGSFEINCGFNNTARSKLKDDYKMRRNSTASLSSFASYGSYTTYERIIAKKGNRREEVVTPVRRSSRIKQLIYP